MKIMKPIIRPLELLDIRKNKSLLLIDASNGPLAQANYEAKHLDGAILLDLDRHLAEIPDDAAHGGRHPLPDPFNFANTLSEFGVSLDSHVVIYDDKQGANAAARLWWMLRAFGHEKVQVLSGGLIAAEHVGFPVNSNLVDIPRTTYPVHSFNLPMAEMVEVEYAALSPDKTVIDVRASERYRGETEPIDKIAGHIPGAINIPLSNNLLDNGHFKSADALQNLYSEYVDEISTESTIVHCGSGVTACHTILALVHAGFEIPKLYVGSWSEWSRNDMPIGKIT